MTREHRHFKFHDGHITWTGKEPPSKEVIESFEELWSFVLKNEIEIGRVDNKNAVYGPGNKGYGNEPLIDWSKVIKPNNTKQTEL